MPRNILERHQNNYEQLRIKNGFQEVLDSLAELYEELCEFDQMGVVWGMRSLLPPTNNALALFNKVCMVILSESKPQRTPSVNF